MSEAPPSAAQRLADEIRSLGSGDLTAEERENARAMIREAIAKGFTASSEDTVQGMLNEDFGDWPHISRSLMREVADDLAALPRSGLTDTEGRLARTHTAFVPLNSWSAMTVRADDSYLVAVDHEIPRALYFLAKLMTVKWTVGTHDVPVESPLEAAGHDIPVELLGRLARVYFGSAELGSAFILATPVWNTERQLEIALGATLRAERFLIHHEVQHILQGHLDSGVQPVDSSPNLGLRHEVEADAGATAASLARFMNHQLDENEEFDLLLTVCGIRLLFEVQDLVEQSHFAVPPRSHPPAKQRFDALRQVALEQWLPPRILDGADALTSTLREVSAICRNREPQPHPAESLHDALSRFPHFPGSPDSEHWVRVDEVEEAVRLLHLSVPQHLAAFGRAVDAPTFARQLTIIQTSVLTQAREKYEELYADPTNIETLRRFGTPDADDFEKQLHGLAVLEFDSTWGARVMRRVLRPAIEHVRRAAADGSGVSSSQLIKWARECAPETATIPAVALLQRLLRDKDADKMIQTIAFQDVTGFEHRMIFGADQGTPDSFVPEWVYFDGRLQRLADKLSTDLVPSAAALLRAWLAEADEAVWRFSIEGGGAFAALYSRAWEVASAGLSARDEAGSDSVTAYLRLIALAKPRHARLCESVDDSQTSFRLTLDILPGLSILADDDRVVELATHLATRAAERGWFDEVRTVLKFLKDSRAEVTQAAAVTLSALLPADS